jgi:hypothetical protein
MMAKSSTMLIAAFVLMNISQGKSVTVLQYSQPHCELIEAPSRCPGPERTHWNAGEYAAKYGPERVTYDDCHDDVVADPECLRGEHSAVLQ